jgi:hypothetical protein
MDDFRVGGMPTPPLDAGFSPEDMARTTGSAPARRAEMSGGLSNAAMTDRVRGNDPAGPNVADWLDAPGPGQDIDIGALMVTLHQAAVTLRTAMHEAQQVERDAQVATMKSEAQDIRNSAGFSFAASVVAGACQVASGSMDVYGGYKATEAAFPDGPDTYKTDDLNVLNEQKSNFEMADVLIKRYSGLGQALGGMGQIVSGGLEYGSHQKDADEKEHEADAAKAAAQVEDQANLLKNIDDLISGVRQTFSQMIEAKNEAMNKITQA